MFIYIFVITVISIVYYVKRKYSYWENKNIVGPKPIPIFGNLLESALRKKFIGVVYNDIYKQFPDEKVIGIYRMTTPALIIRDLDIVKSILIKDFEVFPYRGIDFSKKGLGDNLFHCNSETWRALKGKVSPLFTSIRLKSALHMLTKQANQFTDYIETALTENNEQDLRPMFEKYTMATVMSFIFGIEVDTMNEKNIFAIIDQHCFKSTYLNEADMIFPGILSKLNKSLYDTTANKFCYEIVQICIETQNNSSLKKNDLINILLDLSVKNIKEEENKESENNFKITEDVIASQVLIFFIAGYGNNGSILSYLMYYLAKYPEVQNKLVEEINEIANKFNGELTYEAINEMSYLDNVFNEVLRLHPMTNAIQRCSVMPYTLPGTNIVLDKGTSIIISPYAIHHDEKNYPNPESFDPERFSLVNSRDRHPCAFLPFGTGPRACIGTRFAKLQFAIGAIKFLSKFEVQPSKNTKPIEEYDPMRSLFFPKGGIRVNILQRNNKNWT